MFLPTFIMVIFMQRSIFFLLGVSMRFLKSAVLEVFLALIRLINICVSLNIPFLTLTVHTNTSHTLK